MFIEIKCVDNGCPHFLNVSQIVAVHRDKNSGNAILELLTGDAFPAKASYDDVVAEILRVFQQMPPLARLN